MEYDRAWSTRLKYFKYKFVSVKVLEGPDCFRYVNCLLLKLEPRCTNFTQNYVEQTNYCGKESPNLAHLPIHCLSSWLTISLTDLASQSGSLTDSVSGGPAPLLAALCPFTR